MKALPTHHRVKFMAPSWPLFEEGFCFDEKLLELRMQRSSSFVVDLLNSTWLPYATKGTFLHGSLLGTITTYCHEWDKISVRRLGSVINYLPLTTPVRHFQGSWIPKVLRECQAWRLQSWSNSFNKTGQTPIFME